MHRNSIKYGELSIDFTINEKETIEGKVRIHVLENGEVQVETPPGTPTSQVRESVAKRARWIEKHRTDRHKNKTYSSPRQYVSGETLFYLGRRYQLKVDLQPEKVQGDVKLKNGYFYVGINPDSRHEVQHLLTEWYRSHATQYFENRLNVLKQDLPWARNTDSKLQLRSMKKHWGNCSKTGLITLNPNLVKVPRHYPT